MPESTKPVMPRVLSKDELLDKAFKRVKKITTEIDPKRRVESIREAEIQRINTFSAVITDYLDKIVKESPIIENLMPFHQQIANELIHIPSYKKALASLKWASTLTKELERKYRKKLKGTPLIRLAPVRREFYGRVASILKQISENLDFLEECRLRFKKFPVVHDLPTVIIAGMPNVGKSTLLKNLTNANVEIQPYPFTTKGIQVGVMNEMLQILDTPGLLDRDLDKMNEIERNAIIALNNLSKTLMFLIDPSLTSGYELKKQANLLKNITSWFSFERIYLVLSKTDIASKEDLKKAKEETEKLKEYLEKEKKVESVKIFEVSKDDENAIKNLKNELREKEIPKMKSYRTRGR